MVGWGFRASRTSATTPCLLVPTFSLTHMKVKVLSRSQLFVTSWTVTHQAPLSMKFSR